ncbi:MAG TPA: LacI family DNA-binding transcriptional regulator, partial [Casimicrobiaceae bacterium]|nr:LacI family DNA-binding transcriptional regulator [Casimicrobiaceae bacterium]
MSTHVPRLRSRRASSRGERPRLLDVAHAAGVSTMTVVRVLREPAK